SSRQIITFIGAYAMTSVPLTALLLWSPVAEHGCGRQRFWEVIRTNAVRVGGMLGLLVLVILLARSGAEAWAGRLSALPLIPFYKCLSKNIFTYTANFQDVVRYGAMAVLGLNEAE